MGGLFVDGIAVNVLDGSARSQRADPSCRLWASSRSSRVGVPSSRHIRRRRERSSSARHSAAWASWLTLPSGFGSCPAVTSAWIKPICPPVWCRRPHASPQAADRGNGWIDVHLLASALVARLELWTTDPALATVAKELGISYE